MPPSPPAAGAGATEAGSFPPTQDEGSQVGLQAPELIGVIVQLFLCDPPGVSVGVQPLRGGGLAVAAQSTEQTCAPSQTSERSTTHGCRGSTRATAACSALGLAYLLGDECWSIGAADGREDSLCSLAEGRKENTTQVWSLGAEKPEQIWRYRAKKEPWRGSISGPGPVFFQRPHPDV